MKRLCLGFVALLLASCASKPPPAPAAAAAPSSAAPFKREEVQGLGEPEVVVANLSPRPIRVRITGPTQRELAVGPAQTMREKVPQGIYHYRAETKGATPFDGDQEFSPDGRYTWAFIIKRNMPAPPPSVVEGLRRALESGGFAADSFGGVRLGDPAGKVPPGEKSGDWVTYASGWSVLVEGGVVSGFRFGRNVLSDLMIFDREDLEAKLGKAESSKAIKQTDGSAATILSYDSKRAAFLLDASGEVVFVLLA